MRRYGVALALQRWSEAERATFQFEIAAASEVLAGVEIALYLREQFGDQFAQYLDRFGTTNGWRISSVRLDDRGEVPPVAFA
jgi:hypothetical protein